MIIAVIGASQCSPEEAELARQVGRGLARRKVTLICGGLGGIMEAACQGARMEGGMTVGILPGDSCRQANPYVQIPIVTGMGHARNVLVVKSAQAVIAIGGRFGTLSEVAHALINGIPVIGLNTWSLWKNGREDGSIIPARDAAEAVDKAVTMAAEAENKSLQNYGRGNVDY